MVLAISLMRNPYRIPFVVRKTSSIGSIVLSRADESFGNHTAGFKRRQTCGINIGNNRVFETDIRIVAVRGRFVLRIGIEELIDQIGRKTPRRQRVKIPRRSFRRSITVCGGPPQRPSSSPLKRRALSSFSSFGDAHVASLKSQFLKVP